MIVGIKLGSATLVNDNGSRINEEIILSVCQQIAFLLRKGYDLFLVSSGAIASAPYPELSDSLRSIIGQSSLISKYKKFFNVFGIKAGQLLLTDYDFKNSKTIKWNLWEAFYHKIILIINANDGVWDSEIKALQQCADNDILFYNICNLICPDLAIIGITEPGLLDSQGKIVPIVKVNKKNISKVLKYANRENKFGYGYDGMKTKILVCSKLAKNKIKTILAPTREKDFIVRAIKKEKIGTVFSI